MDIGGATTDARGALQTILSEPFGKIALVLIGIGLIGYVLLRLVQALGDPEHRGSDAKGIASDGPGPRMANTLSDAFSGCCTQTTSVSRSALRTVASTDVPRRTRMRGPARTLKSMLGEFVR